MVFVHVLWGRKYYYLWLDHSILGAGLCVGTDCPHAYGDTIQARAGVTARVTVYEPRYE